MFPASFPPTTTTNAGASHALLPQPLMASDQLLPNEVWARIHAFADLPAKSALTDVDTNLRNFALPTARAHLTAALSARARYEHGSRLARRAVVVLQREFEDPAVRDLHVQKLLVLAITISHEWTDRKSFEILNSALCNALHQLPPCLARTVLANLVMLNQRACTAYADPERNQLVSGAVMSQWRNGLQRQHDQIRVAHGNLPGLLKAETWQRHERHVAESLGIE